MQANFPIEPSLFKQGLHHLDNDFSDNNHHMVQLEYELQKKIQGEEAADGKNAKPPNSLWYHSLRVAQLAERIGQSEGVNLTACRLAGLFHDAGKFKGGCYHNDDKPEEFWSVAALHELTTHLEINAAIIKEVEEAILQLYRNDPDPTPLTQVLFDSDNLDKLGSLGVANYFIKAGLRGKSVAPATLYRISVELTYARYAKESLATDTGRRIAQRRAPETLMFYKNFLESLADDEIFDFRIHEEHFNGMVIDVVAPIACSCGRSLFREISEIPGLKCSEIHLTHSCISCGIVNTLRFCRPRMLLND